MGALKDRLKAKGGSFGLIASGILTAIFNTIALLLIAREIGPVILGALAFLLSFAGLLFFTGDMGNNLAFERLLKQGFGFRKVYGTFLRIKLRLTIQLAVLTGILIGIYVYILAPEGHTPFHPISLMIVTGYFLTMNLAQAWVVSLAARGREIQARSNDLIEGLVKVVLVAGLIFLALPNGDQPILFRLSFIYLMAGTMALMLIRNSARFLKKKEQDDEIIMEFHEESSRLMPYVAMTGLLLSVDKVLLWFFTDPSDAFEALGIFFGAQRITVFIAASSVSIQSLLGNALETYVSDDDADAISETLRMTERYVSLVVLPVACFYILFSSSLLNVFLGEDFAGAAVAVSLLAGAGFFTAMASPHMAYLLKARRDREMTAVGALALGVLLIGQMLLLPDVLGLGLEGIDSTAISLLASAVFAFIAARFFTWKILGCEPHRRILVHLFCAALMMVSVRFLVWYFNITMELKWILVFALAAAFFYGLGLYLSGEMLKGDFLEFKDLTG